MDHVSFAELQQHMNDQINHLQELQGGVDDAAEFAYGLQRDYDQQITSLRSERDGRLRDLKEKRRLQLEEIAAEERQAREEITHRFSARRAEIESAFDEEAHVVRGECRQRIDEAGRDDVHEAFRQADEALVTFREERKKVLAEGVVTGDMLAMVGVETPRRKRVARNPRPRKRGETDSHPEDGHPENGENHPEGE